MAEDGTEIQYLDVNTFIQDSVTYLGIESVAIQIVRGVMLPIRPEGSLVATGYELVGTDEAPLAITIQHRSVAALTGLASKSGDVTFKARNAGKAATRTVTASAVQWERGSLQATRDAKGMFSLSGKGLAFSDAAAGTT